MRIPMSRAKQRLAVVWFVGAGLLFALVLLLSVFAPTVDRVAPLWSWYLPTTLPTLSLIIAVLVSDALGKSSQVGYASTFLYRLTASISIGYLAIVSTTILLQPFTQFTLKELMDMSQLWLGPLQGLTSAALGAFFIQKEVDGSAAGANAATAAAQ